MKKDEGGVLTPEMLEEAALKSLENYGVAHEFYVSPEAYEIALKIKELHPEVHLTCPADIAYYAKKFGLI